MSFLSSINPFGSKDKTATTMGKNFRQWTTAQDGLDNLKLEEVGLPEVKDGEVLVKISAVSLNYRDTEGKCLIYCHFVLTRVIRAYHVSQLSVGHTATTSPSPKPAP